MYFNATLNPIHHIPDHSSSMVQCHNHYPDLKDSYQCQNRHSQWSCHYHYCCCCCCILAGPCHHGCQALPSLPSLPSSLPSSSVYVSYAASSPSSPSSILIPHLGPCSCSSLQAVSSSSLSWWPSRQRFHPNLAFQLASQ
jgi:hypothetical protein